LEPLSACGIALVALSTLGWLLTTNAPRAPPADGDHLEGQRLQDHADVAAVHDVHAEDAAQVTT
jgi:hypothetical protein